MSRSYSFHHTPENIGRSLSARLRDGGAVIVGAKRAAVRGLSPTRASAVAAELRRRRWPAHRVRSFVANLSRRREQYREAAGLRRTMNRARRHRDSQELRNQLDEELA